jgi:hypothetical protein
MVTKAAPKHHIPDAKKETLKLKAISTLQRKNGEDF